MNLSFYKSQMVTSDINNIKRKKNWNAKNKTQGCWVRIKYATSVLCSPVCAQFTFLGSKDFHLISLNSFLANYFFLNRAKHGQQFSVQ